LAMLASPVPIALTPVALDCPSPPKRSGRRDYWTGALNAVLSGAMNRKWRPRGRVLARGGQKGRNGSAFCDLL